MLPQDRCCFGRVALFLCILAVGAGCTDDDGEGAVEVQCSGHGHLHGEHCHCDPGYALTADELGCVVAADVPPAPDQGVEPDAMVIDMADGVDRGVPLDAAVDAGQMSGPPALEFAPSEVRASTGPADDGTQVWLIEATDDDVQLRVEMYEAFGGLTAPGLVEIDATEANYATCGTCLVLQTGCTPHGDHVHCERSFMPRPGGSLRVDAIGTGMGDRLTGACQALRFHEVTIGEDLQTRPVADGASFTLDEWVFDAELQVLGGDEPECSGHGHLHGEHCHCDPGYRVDPEDATRCIPE